MSWLSLELEEVVMKADLSFVHRLFVCVEFCVRSADFCVRIFDADFWRGFFGADFSVRIFRCGFFGAAFCADFLCGRIFVARRPQGERQKKSSKKSIKKSSPKSSPKFPLQKKNPKILPKSLSGHSPVGSHLDSQEVRVHTLMPLWRLAAKVVVFLATGGRG